MRMPRECRVLLGGLSPDQYLRWASRLRGHCSLARLSTLANKGRGGILALVKGLPKSSCGGADWDASDSLHLVAPQLCTATTASRPSCRRIDGESIHYVLDEAILDQAIESKRMAFTDMEGRMNFCWQTSSPGKNGLRNSWAVARRA